MNQEFSLKNIVSRSSEYTFHVFCRDAGAAQNVACFIRDRGIEARCRFYLKGPAREIFSVRLGAISNRDFPEFALDATCENVVLTGRSYISDWERLAIARAKLLEIPSFMFLDHWTNYEELLFPPKHRFQIPLASLVSALPTGFVVGDEWALQCLGRTRLAGAPVEYFENSYFKQMQERFARMQAKTRFDEALFISEPVSQDTDASFGNSKHWGYTEQDVLVKVLEHAPALHDRGIRRLIVRQHPNEPRGNYDFLLKCDIASKADIHVEVSAGNSTLEDQIATARLVIGMESTALFVALLANKPVISFIPENSRKICSLPMSGIVKTRSASELKAAIQLACQ